MMIDRQTDSDEREREDRERLHSFECIMDTPLYI